MQSRRHGGALVVLAPQKKFQAPPNWNVKHYKLVEFWLILCQAPHTNAKPPAEHKAPYWKLSGDGSVCMLQQGRAVTYMQFRSVLFNWGTLQFLIVVWSSLQHP